MLLTCFVILIQVDVLSRGHLKLLAQCEKDIWIIKLLSMRATPGPLPQAPHFAQKGCQALPSVMFLGQRQVEE
jgi:hypothetical protein